MTDANLQAKEFDRVGGPAFPADWNFSSGAAQCPGMTLRDWFAGQVLIGLCQADMSEEEFTVSPHLLARTAYAQADAMIAARKAGA